MAHNESNLSCSSTSRSLDADLSLGGRPRGFFLETATEPSPSYSSSPFSIMSFKITSAASCSPAISLYASRSTFNCSSSASWAAMRYSFLLSSSSSAFFSSLVLRLFAPTFNRFAPMPFWTIYEDRQSI